jgi:hypothetical protein
MLALFRSKLQIYTVFVEYINRLPFTESRLGHFKLHCPPAVSSMPCVPPYRAWGSGSVRESCASNAAFPWVIWQPCQRPGTCTTMISITIIAATIAPSPTTTSIAHCLPLELPQVLVMSVQPCRDSYRACICQRRVSIREKVYKTVI